MGVAIVADAINRFAPTENTLTSIHSDLIQVNDVIIQYNIFILAYLLSYSYV